MIRALRLSKGFLSYPQRVFGVLLILKCVGYLIVTAHTPLSIMVWQNYDDYLGSFVK